MLSWLTYHYYDLIYDRTLSADLLKFLDSVVEDSLIDRAYLIKGIMQEKVNKNIK